MPEKNICGYIGVYQAPLYNLKSSGTVYRSSVYCVATPDSKKLVMVPLVPNAFETMYEIARATKYSSIYVLIPTLDMQFISDLYLFYYEISGVLRKKIDIFTNAKPTIIVTDDFYSHVHKIDDNIEVQIGEYNSLDENLNIVFSFRNEYRPVTRASSDLYIMTNGKRVLFAQYMSEEKIKFLNLDENLTKYDEIHMPYKKNLYGGESYINSRKIGGARITNRLYAYGFQSVEEFNLCLSSGGMIGGVKYNDLV